MITQPRWSNEVLLKSTLAANDPQWRHQVVAWGAAFAEHLLRSPAGVGLPVQVTVSLQSGPGKEDPEADHATGTFHLYCVRNIADDVSSHVDQIQQPVMVLTAQLGRRLR